MRARAAWAALALAALGGGCAHGPRAVANAGGSSGWGLLLDGKSAAAAAAFDRELSQRDASLRARYGRALVAHETGDLERAVAGYVALLQTGATLGPCAHGCADPEWPGLALAAARRLDSLVGEVPGAVLSAPLETLALARLPTSAGRRILAARARLARLNGDEAAARELDRARGCPERWFVAGPYGKLPRLDLMQGYPPESGGERASWLTATTRACVASVEVPVVHSGVVYALGFVRAERDELELVVGTDTAWRLFIDGTEVASAMDEDRYPARERVLSAHVGAGWHLVALKLASAGGRVDFGLSIRGGEIFDGAAPAAPSVSPARPTERAEPVTGPTAPNDAPSAILALEQALARGDADASERLSAQLIALAPRFALGLILAGRAAADDPTRPLRFAQDRARRLFERALAIDPTVVDARYRLAMIAFESERPREALARLADAPAPPKPSWRLELARYLALRARDWMHEAEAALARARAIDPHACPPLEAELALARERHDLDRRVELARVTRRCGGGTQDLADALRDRGDLAGAIAELKRLLTLEPSRDGWRVALADLEVQAGQPARAAEVLAELTRRYPRAAQYRRELADALLAAGDEAGARRALEAGLRETPESSDLRRALQALCGPAERGRCGPMDPFRIDGRDVIATYQKSAREHGAYTSPAVIVLDRTVTRVFATGGRLTLTHNIMQVLTKDGIDKWGEVTIPEGADVFTLRAIKADGTTREPEEIAEKETVSVPDLEVGDYVELEYLEAAGPPAAFPGGFLAERFYFQSYDAPLDRTEYLLALPAGMPVTLDARGDAPTMTLEHQGDLDLRTWSGRRRPQAFTEPAATPFSEFLPSVRAASGLSFSDWRDYLRDSQLYSLRANPELRELAARETRGAASDAEKVKRLDRWVRRHVKDGGSLDEAATSILAREEGNRVTLLAALLRAAHVPVEVWLARQLKTPRLDGPLPDLEAYETPVVHVPGVGVMSPRHRHAPSGFVAPDLRGQRALPLTGGPFRLSELEAANRDHRKMELTATLALDGSAEVRVREELTGWPALQWRDAIDKLPEDRLRPEFEQRTLGFYFPGSTLEELKWEGQDDDDRPFVVDYKFHVPQLARRVGKALILPAPYPATLGMRYVGVAVRRTPLYLEYAAPTHLDARIQVPAGVEVDLPPVAIADGFGHFEQRVIREGGALRLSAFFDMPPARVPPERYRELVDFSVRVDRAEARAAEIRPPASK